MTGDIHTDTGSNRAGAFHPSAAGACLNAQLLEYNGAQAQHSPETYEIFRIGHELHDQVQTAWLNAGVLDHVEYALELPEYYVRGHADGLGHFGPNKFVLEIKSINPRGFAGGLPKSQHIEQVQLYMHITGIRQALVLYVNKDVLSQPIDLSQLNIDQYRDGRWFRWCKVDYDQVKIDERIKYYEYLKWFADNGQLIDEIRYNPVERSCIYCGYSHICSQRGV